MRQELRRYLWLAPICAALATGCYDIADYDEFPGWPDDVPRDTDVEWDTGEPDTGEPDTGEPDTGEEDTGEEDTGEDDCIEVDPGVAAVDVSASCGEGELSSWNEPLVGDVALRIIGIYETDAPHHEMGDCEIELHLDHDVALVFSAYEPAHWIVTNSGSGTITQIIADGYYEPEVTAPDGVPVTILGWDDSYWSSAYDFDDYDAHLLAGYAEAATGLELTSFHGCYQSTWFEVSEGCDGPVESPWPDCTVEGEAYDGPDLSALDGACDEVTEESYYCLTFTESGDVVALGLDTGDTCTVVEGAIEDVSHVDTIAWLGPHLYACAGYFEKLHRVDLTDGTIEEAFVWCGGVAEWDGTLLTKFPGQYGPESFDSMWRYPTFLDAQCQYPDEIPFGTGNSRFTVYGDTLYSAWHSTDEVDVNALPYGADLDTIFLEGYDTWVNGMSVIDGELLVLSASWPEDRVAVFDLGGGFLWEVPATDHHHGLVCMAGE
jgi:hypothetical protein